MTTGKRKEEPASPTKPDRLGQLKLLVAFDALLREGSVSRAAAGMGLPTSSMSRILQQSAREIRRPVKFLRTGQGLRPTPFAETMRLRIRSLAAEAENLIDYSQEKAAAPAAANVSGWERPVLMKAPPLSLRPSVLLEGQPTPENIADRLARIGHNADPQHRLAKYIATSAMGIGNSRPLSQQEAMDALSIILEGDADPIQIGALLATMHYRGVTAAELAGFIEAMWGHIKRDQQAPASVDLDWPAYMSPKHRDAPWFLHSARLVSMAGYSVLLHGHVGQGENGGKLELAAEACGIPLCHSLSQASKATASQGIAYLPIGGLSLQFQSLLGLHGILEMRLPLNTVVHLLNPLRARSTIIGVARPSYQEASIAIPRGCFRSKTLPFSAIRGISRNLHPSAAPGSSVFPRAKMLSSSFPPAKPHRPKCRPCSPPSNIGAPSGRGRPETKERKPSSSPPLPSP
ncbi:LysR family transcriptional regulator [Rhizobium sp. AN95]|uniref:LysR family transcriptional regulator n=1 Tax=Rhizobium sp. AN95 TaxID=3035216 RepID=UPI003A599C13